LAWRWAGPAQRHRLTKRIRLLTNLHTDSPVMHYARSGIYESVLYGLRSWCELANGDVNVSIHCVFRWPLAGIRGIMKQKTHARREANHRQQTGIRKPFA
jgi:hypothetical protein